MKIARRRRIPLHFSGQTNLRAQTDLTERQGSATEPYPPEASGAASSGGSGLDTARPHPLSTAPALGP